MSLFTIFNISSQGMAAQRERLEAASQNLANANSTHTASGKQYQRRDIIFTAQDINEEWRTSAKQSGLFDGKEVPSMGVKSEVSIADENQFNLQYQPWNQDADAEGYVRMPDVNPLEETVNMMSAARSFEANATVFSTAKELARVSINLGDA
ncbi:MAG TPA: flagellar basal body rod protein FlgC [Pyrinomonadaceae bacterium]|nr:flagellar basal body rod protein FlgC [Pyrinomonadaceae bacterium]